MALRWQLGDDEHTKPPEFARVTSTYGHVDISFHRTVRVADNKDIHSLPPTLGPNVLYRASQYSKLPRSIRKGDGLFFPVQGR